MEIEKIINIIEKKYQKENGMKEDFLGLQIKGKKEIKNILLTLDFTNDFLEEIKNYKIDLIISHHPLFFGEKAKLLQNDSILKAKYQFLKKEQINFYALHTNIDFNLDSIPHYQAKKLNCKNIKLIDDNRAISCELENETNFLDFIKLVRKNLDLLNDPFKTNLFFENKEMIKKIIIVSGAGGDILERVKESNVLYIIGELKHHHWIYASDHQLNILEIGHQSEKIFVDLVENFLFENLKTNLKIYKIYENKYHNC
ncbi:/ / NIF3 family protein / 368416:369180 Reverse [Candidatus Hepatoplasma crinochetorum]|uniref:GTP cyclohydrolase 1 type 2 homolog n=1 Tax=Candidatus Hepatoplasma crinochetorum TaxID=295596 RepID=A0A0G7ZMT9_9MOLU|nr:/ / NIF3 family protein / 368416:369180 Reverse [Candidatus Hepatoplasma crinochetorum]